MEKNIYTEESRNDKNETVTKEAKSEKCADVVEVEKQKKKQYKELNMNSDRRVNELKQRMNEYKNKKIHKKT